MFTTIDRVRKVSGMNNSTVVSDAEIRDNIVQGAGDIKGALGRRYTMPFPFRKSNTITFSGTGSGSGTMTITINSVDYTISIVSSLSASQAADLLRTALKDVSEVHTDSIGSGSEVLLISNTTNTDEDTAELEVNVASISDVQGISASVGTILDRYPPSLSLLNAEYAAALLISNNYGPVGEQDRDSVRDWFKRLEELRKKLTAFQGFPNKGEPDFIIYDEITDEEIPLNTPLSPQYLPNETTNADTVDPSTPKFTMNQSF